jgi:class 3 adenylate cyclase
MIHRIDRLRDACGTLREFCRRLTALLKRRCDAAHAFVFWPGERQCLPESDFVWISPAFDDALAKKIARMGSEILNASDDSGVTIRKVGRTGMHLVAYAGKVREHRLVVGLCFREEARTKETASLIEAAGAPIDSAFGYYLERRDLNDSISILDSLHRLDTEGDRTKNEGELLSVFVSELKRKIRPAFVVLFLQDPDADREGRFAPVLARGRVPGRSKAKLQQLAERTFKEFRIHLYGRGESGLRQVGIQNALFVPLGVERAEGVFALGNKEGGLTDLDRRLADEIESIADSILKHARAYNELERRKNELHVLYTIDRIRDTSESFDELIDRVLEELVQVIESRSGFVVLYDRFGKLTSIRTYPDGPETPTVSRDVLLSISERAIRERRIVCRNKTKTRGVQNWIAIPLILNDLVIGVFGAINAAEGRFGRYHRALLQAIGSQVDTAIFEDYRVHTIKKIFKRYVSDKVVEEMLKTEESDFLTGRRQELSILFIDIRGFTDVSEEMDPKLLVQTVNEYVEAMAEEILRHEGTIDKIVGDEIMALFGAPVFRNDHAVTAVASAIDMQRAMTRLRKHWKTEGKRKMSAGIGINSGPAIVGNIGCEKISDYTAMGGSVNLASRLCGKALPDQILISEATHRAIQGAFPTRALGPILIKGFQQPVPVYEVLYD